MKFFLQYLASPLAVVALGAFFTQIINREQREFEELQVAHAMLPALFSTDKYQALATKRLLDEVITDGRLRVSLGEIVEDFLTSEINQAVAQGDLGAAKAVYDAASAIGGISGEQIASTVNDNMQTRDKLTRYEQAQPHELAALEAIAANDLETGLREIRAAEDIYPDLHSVREIRTLLESAQEELDIPETQAEIRNEIVDRYSWRVPAPLVERLRDR
jgi:hypothetical protein